MKILITGAGGFVGNNLVDYLSTDPENSIIALTHKQAAFKPGRNIENITADLTSDSYQDKLPSGIDVVIYLAQSSAYRNFPEGAADMFAINVDAVASLLDWSAKNGIKKFIHASTGNVYVPASRMLNEEDVALPSSYYAATKLSAEHLVRSYQSLFNAITLRVFSVYGQGQQGMMFPGMISRIKSGEMITLAQNKGIMLSPLYISDAVRMISGIISSEMESGAYNFCGNQMVSLGEIVDTLGRLMKIKPQIAVTDEPVNYLVGDGNKLYKAIQYTPVVDIEQGLKQVLNQ